MHIPTQKKSGIPLIGLGTWRLVDDECQKVVETALSLGYRHIDTADAYQNHIPIGKAIRHVPRKELYLVSKLALHRLQPAQVREDVPRFLDELGTDYLDLLLIHWPDPHAHSNETLDVMMELKEKGLVRSIGVSNFVRFHLEKLEPYHYPILTNQIELHPYFQRKLLVAACLKWGISVTAYRPLGKGEIEKDPLLQEIGKNHGKTASQVALRWLVQQDFVVIPKASSFSHLKANFEIFDFVVSDQEMEEIDGLDQGKRFCAPEGYPIYED